MSVDLHSEDDLRAAIAELADAETPELARVLPHRTERPKRINRLAPLAAAAAVLLVVGIAVFVSHTSSNNGDTLAVGRTEATAAQPCRSTTTPPFDTFVLTGVQTVAQAACSGYRLRYVDSEDVDSVTLYRPGVLTLRSVLHRQRVTGAGVTGWVGTMSLGWAAPCYDTDPQDYAAQAECGMTVFVWQYAANAWGVVRAIGSAPTSAMLRVAGAVRLRAIPLRFPAHLSYLPADLHATRAASYSSPAAAPQRQGARGADLQLSRRGTVVYDIAVQSVSRGRAPTAPGQRRVTVHGDAAYVQQTSGQATLLHGNCQLSVLPKTPVSPRESLRILRGARLSDCTKPSTWPTANDAVGG